MSMKCAHKQMDSLAIYVKSDTYSIIFFIIFVVLIKKVLDLPRIMY